MTLLWSFQSMLVLSVSPEVYFALEAFTAEVACKWLEACVLAAVRDEVRALTESFSTNLTLVRLLPSMDVRMFLHV